MTTDTPWQRRLISAADLVAMAMGYCFVVRDKPVYAVVGLLAAFVSVSCRLLYRMAREQKHRQPHGATR